MKLWKSNEKILCNKEEGQKKLKFDLINMQLNHREF